MIPTLFQLGPLPVHSFGLLMVLAFLSAWRILWVNLRAAGKPPELAERMITWAAVGGIAGARIGYLISFPSELMEHPLQTIFSGAGFVFHWGLVGGAFAVWLLLRSVGQSFWEMADLTGIALVIGYAVGRIGCQLSGDGDYGMASTLPWAMGYPQGVVPTPAGVTVHPAPVYETILAILIAFVLSSAKVRSTFRRPGQMFGIYLVLVALERFLVEFVRIEPIVLPPFTQAQVMSIILASCGFLLLAFPRSGASCPR
ncbi:MAG: prolipoprotein diacylglyceryl transferase [Bdellovibrionota bacterium]